jgi:hypothetical protein
MLLFQDAELFPQRQIFQDQIAARTKISGRENNQEPQEATH